MNTNRKLIITAIVCLFASFAMAQTGSYWVFFTDKNNTSFDPYSYFDSKAIERYNLNHENLYDITNYPVNSDYESQVENLSEELVGSSRWFNASGVIATDENIARIAQLPFVKKIVQISSCATLASNDSITEGDSAVFAEAFGMDHDQIMRFNGNKFIKNGIDGKGLRIAVLDGGFPGVNTHEFFEHLRNNKQIVGTYNFPNKKEDVYGWNSHGTMVLSCIAGMIYGYPSGLAQGSEFLLARTEVNSEPFKEEVWWMMAVEWADKNGADIINSSLGYGKERHWTKDMDGTSYVAKAANMAARKGILVCCSAGNEGDDRRWKTIVTPSDADSVLCVGGIEPSLYSYSHISFSSFGPSADGRIKPNVCAFGRAVVADPKGGQSYVDGTSFSSPLTAGFCACAWQTRRNLTAMQMKEEIEKSGDLYPYFDYAFGYGVPQATYFVGGKTEVEPQFTISEDDDFVNIKFLHSPEIIESVFNHEEIDSILDNILKSHLFVSLEGSDGKLLKYYSTDIDYLETKDSTFSIPKAELKGAVKVNVTNRGYYESYSIKSTETENEQNLDDFEQQFDMVRSVSDNKVKKEYLNSSIYLKDDFIMPLNGWWGTNFDAGYRRMVGWKRYKVGLGAFIGNTTINHRDNGDKLRVDQSHIGIEALQHVVIVPGLLFWDTYGFGSYGYKNYERIKTETDLLGTTPYAHKYDLYIKNCDNINRLQYGVGTCIGFSIMSAFNVTIRGNYMLSDFYNSIETLGGHTLTEPSKWSVGIECGISF